MKKLLLTLITLTSFALMGFCVPIVAHANPLPMPAFAAVDCNTSTAIPLLPTWYKYLDFDTSNDGCDIKMVPDDLPKSIVLIGLAIIEMLLVLAGIVAVIMVMVGGFKYVISQGEPDKIANAKNTIINSLIGAVIAIVASQLVTYVVSTFVGSGTNNPNFDLFQINASGNKIRDGLSVFFAVIGAVSVFMVVLGGFNFIISRGNAEKIAKARRTIFYALIGLVVAIFASAIVSFVLKESTK